jgi:hypothetical protein
MTTLAVELKLDDKDVKLICSAVPGDFSAATKVGRVALSLLNDLADGGMMLPCESVAAVRKAISSIRPEDIVSSVESSVNRQGDHLVLKMAIDPSWEPRLREIAEIRGHPVEQLMQECMATAMSQGWLYDNVIPPDPPPVSFSRNDYESLRKVVAAGGPLFGEDIAAWVRGHGEMAKHAG